MITNTNIAWITPIDSNKIITSNGSKIYRFYEDEAIRCIKSIRRNSGWLKNCNIYVLNLNNSKLKTSTYELFKTLNITYIEDYYHNSAEFSTGFLNEPYTGKYFEFINPIKEEITIKIDLDMQVLKPIPKDLIEQCLNGTIIGQYDIASMKMQRTLADGNIPFDTNFIISHRKHNFYKLYFDLCLSDTILDLPEWKSLQKIYGNYFIEEFVVDYIYKNKLSKIIPIQYYQYGEGYPSIITYPHDKIKNILFLHEHIYKNNVFPYDYNSIQEQMTYLKLSKKYNI